MGASPIGRYHFSDLAWGLDRSQQTRSLGVVMDISRSIELDETENSQNPMPRILGLAICIPFLIIFVAVIALGCFAFLQIDAHMPKSSSTAQLSHN